MEDLTKKQCLPCDSGLAPLAEEKIQEFLPQVPGWKLTEGVTAKGKRHLMLTREFKFGDFMPAVNFVNRVAAVAEAEGHHPDIYIYYNRVRLDLWTHAITGLFDNDFIIAAKINKILEEKVN